MNHIIAMGGGGFSMEPDNPALDRYIVAQARGPKPKVCFLPTATDNVDSYLLKFYRAFSRLECRPSHLSLFSLPASFWRDHPRLCRRRRRRHSLCGRPDLPVSTLKARRQSLSGAAGGPRGGGGGVGDGGSVNGKETQKEVAQLSGRSGGHNVDRSTFGGMLTDLAQLR